MTPKQAKKGLRLAKDVQRTIEDLRLYNDIQFLLPGIGPASKAVDEIIRRFEKFSGASRPSRTAKT